MVKPLKHSTPLQMSRLSVVMLRYLVEVKFEICMPLKKTLRNNHHSLKAYNIMIMFTDLASFTIKRFLEYQPADISFRFK